MYFIIVNMMTSSFDLPCELVTLPLSLNKHEDLGVAVAADLLQQAGKLRLLLPVLADINNLNERMLFQIIDENF